MAKLWNPTKVQDDLRTVSFGTCLWELTKGHYIMDEEGNYFCSQGRIGDRSIEIKMRDAVKSTFNIVEGRAVWLPGRRKISDNEWADQMQEILDGKNPDPVDVWRQLDK